MHAEHVQYLHKLFAEILRAVPTIELEDKDEWISIGRTILISDTTIEVPTIGRWMQQPGFKVEVVEYTPATRGEPEDGDVRQVAECRRFEDAAKQALLTWVGIEATAFEENEGVAQLAKEWNDECTG